MQSFSRGRRQTHTHTHIIIIGLRTTYHKESIRRLDVLASIVFLAFDPPISPSTLGTQSRRNICDLPEESTRVELVVVAVVQVD
jgi:hypothetical protein